MAKKQTAPVPGNMTQIRRDILSGLPEQLDIETSIEAAKFNLVESPAAIAEADVVPDGDFAGMRTEDVLRALTDGIHDVFADQGCDLATAGASLDMALGEYLGMVQLSIGDQNAKLAALAFAETVLPFATLPTPIVSTYAEALKIRGHRK